VTYWRISHMLQTTKHSNRLKPLPKRRRGFISCSHSAGQREKSLRRPTWHLFLRVTFPQATAAKTVCGQCHSEVLCLLFRGQCYTALATTGKVGKLQFSVCHFTLYLKRAKIGNANSNPSMDLFLFTAQQPLWA
jgi:hypothetical protein